MAKRKTTDQVQINVRMREGLRAKLEQSAKKNYESLNREIIDRLERSFDRQELLVEALTLSFGERLAGLLMAVGRGMEATGNLAAFASKPTSAMNWAADPFAYAEAVRTATLVLAAFLPPGEKVGPSKFFSEQFPNINDIHAQVAATIVESIRGKAPPEHRAWASTVRKLLNAEGEQE